MQIIKIRTNLNYLFIFLIENLNSNIQLWKCEDYSVLNKYIIIDSLRETKQCFWLTI